MAELSPEELERLRPVSPLRQRGAVALWRMTAPDGRDVAVKTIVTPLLDFTTRAAFMRRLGVVLRLRHPHLARVYAGRLRNLRECVAVIEFAPRGSLLDAVAPGERRLWTLPLAPGEAVRLISETAAGVGALHTAQVVHGALKFTNILVSPAPDGQLRARVTDPLIHLSLTAARSLAPRPTGIADPLLFVAPEAYRHGAVAASDQYALAVIAYILLTGESPLSVDPAAWLQDEVASPPRRASAVNPTLPSAVDAVLARGLRRSPRARYRSVEEFAVALAGAVDAPEVARSVRVPWSERPGAPTVSRSLATPQLHEVLDVPRPLAVVATEPGTGPLGMPQLPANYRWTTEALASLPAQPAPTPNPPTVRRRGPSGAVTVALSVGLGVVALATLLLLLTLLVTSFHP